jgi:hypothetical protein
MKLEHLRVVLAVEEALGASVMSRVGWGLRSRRRALAWGALARGKVDLAAREYGDAYESYREALTTGLDSRVRLRAVRGMASARVRAFLARLAAARERASSS